MKDLIDRQAAIDIADDLRDCISVDGYWAWMERLKKLPSAQPERKKGRWIKVNGKTAINCSACYHCSWSRSFEDTVKRFNFCPNCGARQEWRGRKNDRRD